MRIARYAWITLRIAMIGTSFALGVRLWSNPLALSRLLGTLGWVPQGTEGEIAIAIAWFVMIAALSLGIGVFAEGSFFALALVYFFFYLAGAVVVARDGFSSRGQWGWIVDPRFSTLVVVACILSLTGCWIAHYEPRTNSATQPTDN